MDEDEHHSVQAEGPSAPEEPPQKWYTIRWRDLTTMKKVVIIVLALVVFILILTLAIAPLQGAFVSSTSQQAPNMSYVDPNNQENFPVQENDLGSQGRSIFIAVVMLAHMLFANLQLGGSWVAASTETMFYIRKKERYQRLSRSIALFNLILFSAGATFAATGMFFFIGLFPKLSSVEFHIWWFPLLCEAVLFATQILLVGLYWYSWGKVGKVTHQMLGYGFALATFFQTLMINTLAAGMLTPGGSELPFTGASGISLTTATSYLSWWFNATTWNLQFHRIGAALSFFGFVLAMLGVFHYVDRREVQAKKYWDWVTGFGVAIGLAGLAVQPVFGVEYVTSIMNAQPAAFEQMMHGGRAWEMLLMVGLFSTLAVTAITYFIDRRESVFMNKVNRRIRWVMYLFLIVVAICGLILVQPSWLGANNVNDPSAWTNPLGSMDYKYIAIFIITIIAGMLIVIDLAFLSRFKEEGWGNMSRASKGAAALMGFLSMWILIVMGFVRESSRSPWTIYNVIPVAGGQAYPTPISLWTIFIIWAILLSFAITVYWFTSRVTARQPAAEPRKSRPYEKIRDDEEWGDDFA